MNPSSGEKPLQHQGRTSAVHETREHSARLCLVCRDYREGCKWQTPDSEHCGSCIQHKSMSCVEKRLTRSVQGSRAAKTNCTGSIPIRKEFNIAGPSIAELCGHVAGINGLFPILCSERQVYELSSMWCLFKLFLGNSSSQPVLQNF